MNGRLAPVRRWLSRVSDFDADKERACQVADSVFARHVEPFVGTEHEAFARVQGQFRAGAGRWTWPVRWGRALAGIPYVAWLLLLAVRRAPTPADTSSYAVTSGTAPEYEVPGEIQSRGRVVHVPGRRGLRFREALRIVRGLLRVGCWSPEVHAKSLDSVGRALGAMRSQPASAYLSWFEWDFTCSVVSHFARREGCRAINIMHGDKGYYPRDSFFAFDEYWVWHDGYAEIARRLHADVGHYEVFTPSRLRAPDPQVARDRDVGILWPSYRLSQQEQAEFASALAHLPAHLGVWVRPHPRYRMNPGLDGLLERFEGRTSGSAETGIEFIDRCRVVVGYQSTALIEAAARGAEACCVVDSRFRQIEPYHPYFGRVVAGVAPSELTSWLASRLGGE